MLIKKKVNVCGVLVRFQYSSCLFIYITFINGISTNQLFAGVVLSYLSED